jgi:hypothetical protein
MASIHFIFRCGTALALLVAAGWAAHAAESKKAGEWKGTFDWLARQPVPAGTQYFSGHLKLTLDEDEDGTLKGTLSGDQSEKLDLSSCPSVAISPGSVTARLAGKIVQQQPTIDFFEPTYSPPQMSPCPTGGPPATSGPVYKFPHFSEALHGLTPIDEYTYQFDREWTVTVGRYPFTLRYTIKFDRIEIIPRAAD